MTLAGTPTAVESDGIPPITTAPAPILTLLPIVTNNGKSKPIELSPSKNTGGKHRMNYLREYEHVYFQINDSGLIKW